jgi:hypothetical protein
MHCATGRIPVAMVDLSTDTAVLIRDAEPVPRHPKYPGGTVVASVEALLRGGDDKVPVVLRHVIEARFERDTDELAYFLERFIRPLVRSFRIALDTHRLGLYGLDPARVGFELSPEFEATGRVLVHDMGAVQDLDTGPARTQAGVERLVGTLDVLQEGFGRIQEHHQQDEVRAAVEEVIAEELRCVEEHTAEVLSGKHPLRRFVHSITPGQDTVLRKVLWTVQERTRSRRGDPRLPRPVVVVDLDQCGIVPLRRTLDALGAVSGPRAGAPDGIPEFAQPGTLPLLPTYTRHTWSDFLAQTGIGAKYQQVDWNQVHSEFFDALARPRERLSMDSVTAGLARFVWDVQDAGGQVIFCTGRRERVRTYTEEVLARAGVPPCPLLCMPDDSTAPIPELKVGKLRELAGVEVVAVFDDLVDNRVAVTEQFPDAQAVAVAVPGFVAECGSRVATSDDAPLINTFERSPGPVPTRRAVTGPHLSNTHSLEEVQIGGLRLNRAASGWAAYLDASGSAELVETILSDVDAAAERTGRAARAKFGLDGEFERNEDTLRALHHVFTRKQFLKGTRAHYQYEHVNRDVAPFLRQQRPIDVVLLGFPVKQCLNRLKASGPLPDLAELGGLARLRELQRSVRAVYPPGLRFRILTDGRHFRPRPAALTGAYGRKLREYVDLVGIGECTVIEEVDEVARRRIGADLPALRSAHIDRHQNLLRAVLRKWDIADNPLRALDEIDAYASTMDESDALARSLGQLREMLMSLVFSVPVSPPRGTERLAWSKLVYADLYNLTDRTVPTGIRQARIAVLRRAWHSVIRYLSVLRADEELGYEDLLFPDRIRLTVSAADPGRCGFTYLGGSGLLPWQGTGVLDTRGRVAVDFQISLLDQGFLPVYSALLGPRQPWLMVPGQRAWSDRSCASTGTQLDGEYLRSARLRRK